MKTIRGPPVDLALAKIQAPRIPPYPPNERGGAWQSARAVIVSQAAGPFLDGQQETRRASPETEDALRRVMLQDQFQA